MVSLISDRLTAVLREETSSLRVAGAVVGVAIGDEQISLAHGVTNVTTGQPFTEDTGFLLGSVTKVMTATVLMQLVERGEVDLDAPAKRYVPEFTLRDSDAAEEITVRMLVNHTNGIDADLLFPRSVRGRDASRSYTGHLPQMGVLFEPGVCIHYSNPGFVLAARIIEERTGLPFERAIELELFEPAGMRDATALQTQAFLRRTAVGAVADPGSSSLRATPMFTYSESGAGAGATLIVTVNDLFAFGRMHLRDGVAVDGTRVLSTESAQAMRSPTFDLGVPQAPPIGLGWWLVPVAGTTALHHGGGSPGGTSSFCIIPDYNATIASFAAGPDSGVLNDLLHVAVLEEITQRPVTPPLDISPTPVIAKDMVGEYTAFQRRVAVEVNGEDVVVTEHFEPYDDEHKEVYDGIVRFWLAPRRTYRSVAPGQFVESGTDLRSLSGFGGRNGLLASLPAASGRRAGLHTRFRYIPKVA